MEPFEVQAWLALCEGHHATGQGYRARGGVDFEIKDLKYLA